MSENSAITDSKDEITSGVRISVAGSGVFNFAMQQNHINLIKTVTVTNTAAESYGGVRISFSSDPAFHSDFVFDAGHLEPGQAVEFKNPSLPYLFTYLSQITERQNATVTVTAYSGERQIGKTVFAVKLLAFSEWAGNVIPEILAAFSLPGDPAVTSVISEAADLLKKEHLHFDGYQSGNPNNVKKQIAAIYSVLAARRINYSMPPASFETTGQKIRFPSDVLYARIGTCLDTTMLICSCMEAVGLHALAIIIPGHAMAGCWLVEKCFSDSASDDTAGLVKRMADGVGHIVTIETTCLPKNEPFETAVSASVSTLRQKNLDYCIDIKRARIAGILPLPVMYDDKGNSFIDEKSFNEAEMQRVRRVNTYEVDITGNGGTADRFAKWERDLLDISLSNPLVSYRLNRAGVPILCNDAEAIEDALSQDKQLQILPKPKELVTNARNLTDIIATGDTDVMTALLGSELGSGRLRAFMTESELSRRLTEVYRAAKNSVEETGASTLFLALGFLKWYDTGKGWGKNGSGQGRTPRYSPIVLIPVDLVRRSVKSGYSIRMRDSEVQVNLSMIENLRLNFDIDATCLLDMPKGDFGYDLTILFTKVRNLIMNMKEWDVLEAASLGNFHFSRFVMWNDLKNRSDSIKKHPLIRSLLTGKLDNQFVEQEHFAVPERIYAPLPADSSQLTAIKDAVAGKTFVLHGPPGSGKSQTIANIIANCLAAGKRTLFIAEKTAALEVVKKRLVALGLGDFCLELHSNKTTKRNVLLQFEGISEINKNAEEVKYAEAESKMLMSGAELDAFNASVHDIRDSGFSVFEGINEYLMIPDSPVSDIVTDGVTKEIYEDDISDLGRLAALSRGFSEPKFSPFYIIRHKTYSTKFGSELKNAAEAVGAGYFEARAALKEFCESFDIDDEDLDIKKLSELYGLLSDTEKYAKKGGFSRFMLTVFSSRYRSYHKSALKTKAEEFFKSSPENFSERLAALRIFMTAEKQLREVAGCDEDTSGGVYAYSDYMRELSRTAGQMVRDIDGLKEYMTFFGFFTELENKGRYAPLLRAYFDGDIAGSSITDSYRKNFWKCWLTATIASEPQLDTFLPNDFDNKIKNFAAHCDFVGELAVKEIYRIAAARVPSFRHAAVASSEPGILSKALRSQGRGMSIRQLFGKIPGLLATAKPVMLMSPLSAAQYLPPDFPDFDVVVYDEASQLITCEAVGSLSRAKSAVIVGDPKQLPPTTFFRSSGAEAEDDFEVIDLESLLDDVLSLNVPGKYLKWHYRSAHESLITFSNLNYYDSRLITFPSSDNKVNKVSLKLVGGTYDRGNTRTNPGEAAAVVGYLFDRLEKEGDKSSFGIITFNSTQQKLIEDMIDDRLEKSPDLERYFNQPEEPVFVKNIENVQGDERDIILFSVTYGRDKDGKMTVNFGPVNKQGGWRRLNVAVTRSKKEMVVFSTISGADIDSGRTSSLGVEGLKEFLTYAGSPERYTVGKGLSEKAECAVVREIAEALSEKGYETVCGVGSSVNKVDIAVKDKTCEGFYALGIIIDTKTFGSISNTRDREYAKISLLRRYSWNVLRVYALEWWENKQKVIAKIIDAIERGGGIGEDLEKIKEKIAEEHGEARPVAVSVPDNVRPYEEAKLKNGNQADFYLTASDAKILPQIKSIVEKEAPVSKAVLVRKIAAAWNFTKISEKFTGRIDALLDCCGYFMNKSQSTVFVWKDRTQSKTMDYYRDNSVAGRDAESICKEEFAAAMLGVLKSCLRAGEEDLVRETARQFGFTVKTPSVWNRVGYAASVLIDEGKAVQDGSGKLCPT